MDFERKLLNRYRQAFHQLASATSTSIGPSYGERIREVAADLDRDYDLFLDEEAVEKLSGRGTISRLKHQLGLSKSLGKNLLTRVSQEERVRENDLFRLIEEFLHVKQTGLKRGGLYELVYEKNQLLPDQPESVRAGIYRVRGVNGSFAPCLVLQCLEGGVLHFLFIILTQQEFNSVEMGMMTFLEDEGEWLSHQHWEVLSKKTLRSAMVAAIKKMGMELAMPVPLAKVRLLINESLKPLHYESHKHFTLEFQGYRLCVDWTDNDDREPGYHITLHDVFVHNPVTGLREPKAILWDSLNMAKQFQLYKATERKIKELTA